MTGDFYDNEAVAAIINDYGDANELSDKEIAEILDIHPTSLSRIKAGKHCSEENLQKIAALGGKQIKDLVKDIPDKIKDEMLFTINSGNPVIV